MKITNIKELQKNQSLEIYNCGSQKLSHEIRTKLNLVPVDIYKHKKTGKLINVYIMTDELSKFLIDWTNNRPLKNKEVN